MLFFRLFFQSEKKISGGTKRKSSQTVGSRFSPKSTQAEALNQGLMLEETGMTWVRDASAHCAPLIVRENPISERFIMLNLQR